MYWHPTQGIIQMVALPKEMAKLHQVFLDHV